MDLENKKKDFFNIILVDIDKFIQGFDICCVKKDMYKKDIKYICISYRWGVLQKWSINTPDYIAYVTSFDKNIFIKLCKCIKTNLDLCKIRYLWIDGICVNQQNEDKKRETIKNMKKIYEKSTYILAIPDLHINSLKKDDLCKKYINIIKNHKKNIYQKIIKESIKDSNFIWSIVEKNKEEINKAISFLNYLFNEWSNRTWVISEFIIAKKKDNPMKLIFISLFLEELNYEYKNNYPFFNLFNRQQHLNDSLIKQMENNLFTKEPIDMILNSKVTKNEDRFHAILPLLDNYKHIIKDKNTIFEWNITNMMSIRIKLYEIMDLSDKIKLLHACSDVYEKVSEYEIEKIKKDKNFLASKEIKKLEEKKKYEKYASFYRNYNKGWIFTDIIHNGEYKNIKNLEYIPILKILKNNEKIKLSFKKNAYINNITNILLSQFKDSLNIKCDIYYKVEYNNKPTQKDEKFVIIPLYRLEIINDNKNIIPSNCFIPLIYKKYWEICRISTFTIEPREFIQARVVSSINFYNMKINGSFIVK